MLIRYVVSFGLAAIVTLGLFFTMQSLISTQGKQAIECSHEILSSRLKISPAFQARVAKMLAEKRDVTSLVVEQLTTPT